MNDRSDAVIEDRGVFRCWKCGNEIHVARTQAGAAVECPHCQSTASVPDELFEPPLARTIRPVPSVRQKSPETAGVLNFIFWGAGYVYAGKPWGWAVLGPSILLVVIGLDAGVEPGGGELCVGMLISLALGWHAYQIVKGRR